MHLHSLLLSVLFLLRSTSADEVNEKWNPKDDHSWELDFGSYPYQTYRTVDLIAPVLRKAADSPQCHDDNYIFLSPRGYTVPHPAVAILDNQGELVWEHYVPGQGYNLKVQEYQGEKVMTFWVGDDGVGGHGEGDYYMYNSRYEEIAKISGLNGMRADLHELTITPQGTAMMSIYQIYPVQHPGLIKDQDTVWIWDGIFQEIDIATNELIFEWRASDHHSLDETYREVGDDGWASNRPWDWYHINSIQKDELGNYLVSARYTHTITYINGTDGEIIWVLGGKRNAFEDLTGGNAVNIAYQHFARFHNITEFPELLADEIQAHGQDKDKDGVTKMLVSAFDNGADHEWTGNRASRGVLIEVSYPSVAGDQVSADVPHTARLVQSYEHPAQFVASSQGSMQILPSEKGDPRVLLGYGYVGVWTEFSADGKLLCDNRFSTIRSWGSGHVQSYRALKGPWTGNPTWPPMVAFGDGYRSSVFVSWNGATEVRYWKIQQAEKQGDLDDSWVDIKTVEKDAFEMEIMFEATELRFMRVVALDKYNNILGISANLDLGWKFGVNHAINGFRTTINSPIQLVMLSLAGLTLVVIAYEGFRQFKKWRTVAMSGYEKVRVYSDASYA